MFGRDESTCQTDSRLINMRRVRKRRVTPKEFVVVQPGGLISKQVNKDSKVQAWSLSQQFRQELWNYETALDSELDDRRSGN